MYAWHARDTYSQFAKIKSNEDLQFWSLPISSNKKNVQYNRQNILFGCKHVCLNHALIGLEGTSEKMPRFSPLLSKNIAVAIKVKLFRQNNVQTVFSHATILCNLMVLHILLQFPFNSAFSKPNQLEAFRDTICYRFCCGCYWQLLEPVVLYCGFVVDETQKILRNEMFLVVFS